MIGSDGAVLSAMAASAFIASTLFPASSEAVFAGFLAAGYGRPLLLFMVAVLFNALGGFTNWLIGRAVDRASDSEKGHQLLARFRLSEAMLARMRTLFARYGFWTLLFSWLPVIGDPITLFAGMARYPLVPFLVLMTLGKALRYAALWGAVAGLLPAVFS